MTRLRTRLRAFHPIGAAMLLLSGSACLDTETDPFEQDFGPPADIDGVWSYTAQAGSLDRSCTAGGITLDFEQDSLEFSGTASGGTLTCQFLGDSTTDSIGIRPVLQGIVRGEELRFAIGNTDWIHLGIVSTDGRVIIGDVEIILRPPEIAPQALQGFFEARRQSGEQELRAAP